VGCTESDIDYQASSGPGDDEGQQRLGIEVPDYEAMPQLVPMQSDGVLCWVGSKSSTKHLVGILACYSLCLVQHRCDLSVFVFLRSCGQICRQVDTFLHHLFVCDVDDGGIFSSSMCMRLSKPFAPLNSIRLGAQHSLSCQCSTRLVRQIRERASDSRFLAYWRRAAYHTLVTTMRTKVQRAPRLFFS
jgi:hypothetical protein